MISANIKAFLDTIAFSEIGAGLLVLSDNGYDVLVGSTPSNRYLFKSYDDHPRVYNSRTNSTAAGRYQILASTFDSYRKLLGLHDFSHASQDAIAMQLIKECRAVSDIDAGLFNIAIAHCAHIWASLPGAGYGQHENNLQDLSTYYKRAGGTVAVA